MKNILIFNDISGLGNNSMVANVSVFARLGHYCMPVPTACYSCHTGFDNFTAVKNNDTVDFARRICANAKADAFYVGFCNDTATLQGVQTVVTDVLGKDTYLFVDPIMGDNGRLYPVFDGGYVSAMKAVVRQACCVPACGRRLRRDSLSRRRAYFSQILRRRLLRFFEQGRLQTSGNNGHSLRQAYGQYRIGRRRNVLRYQRAYGRRLFRHGRRVQLGRAG